MSYTAPFRGLAADSEDERPVGLVMIAGTPGKSLYGWSEPVQNLKPIGFMVYPEILDKL
jgi:hypothetical protein